MNRCPEIIGLKLDEDSLRAIQRMRDVVGLAQLGALMTGTGVMSSIFYRNNTAVVAYNIYGADWKFFAQTIQVWPAVAKNRMRVIAEQEVFSHQMDRKQKQFW